MTALHVAIYKEHPDVARCLIEHGADVHVKDRWGMTPHMTCALRSKVPGLILNI